MPIPALNQDGFLPEGIHDCTLLEIKERFGAFQRTDQRCRLFERLEKLLREIHSTGMFQAVIVDGSFVTGVDDPHDIDLILVVPPTHDFAAELRPLEYNVLSKQQIRRQYGFDAIVARADHPELARFIDFFGQVRLRPGVSKGLLRLKP